MESKNAEDQKSSPRRDLRFSRSGRNQKAMAQNILEAIAQFSGGEIAAAAEDGRMKIVVKKEDLKQVLEAIRDGRSLGRRDSGGAGGCGVGAAVEFVAQKADIEGGEPSEM
ncbi:hypothetical protein PHJA_001555800 [Phtheirospermum japonicum]|uniref:Uncharacterized protein n=1 Tax=Phtheirospermum japonicum TaxID=374723 RepID=A0A830CCP8_9LAMI|nr:hypothetical protein PHJA_001555800 [Phtheirospermum japonicum]